MLERQAQIIDYLTRRKFIALVGATLLTSSFLSSSAHASNNAKRQVTAIADDVMRLAKSGRSAAQLRVGFKNLLNKYADMSAVARYALGPYRKKLPSNLKAEYYNAVTEYIAGLFAYYVKDFNGTGLDIQKIVPRGNSEVVNSKIRLTRGGTAPVNWMVYTSGSRSRVTDVQVRGVWMSITMRQEFVNILNRSKGDFDPLMKYLNEVDDWFK